MIACADSVAIVVVGLLLLLLLLLTAYPSYAQTFKSIFFLIREKYLKNSGNVKIT